MEIDLEKTCSTCKATTWESEFPIDYKAGNGRRTTHCKHCVSLKRSRSKAVQRCLRAAHLALYGITSSDYDSMLKRQGGVCAICGSDRNFATVKRTDGQPANFAVDHDHETGKVRGLLCHGCNQGLGKFKDSAELLRKAAEYLKSSTA